MSLQDKMEQILKNIHLLFSASKPYGETGEWIIVEKQKVFEQLEQLNLAVYEMMDTYEMTNQKHELAQRRCEKRGEEIIQKASRHADDIYAASIMYTDDAINRICHIMEDANDSVRKVFRGLNNEMERERERVRRNQLELTSQLQDFADTNKYIKLIEEINKKLERERIEEAQAQKDKRIQNEGKSYSSIQPEIHVNEAYLERMERNYNLTPLEINVRKEEQESLVRVTGKEFAESLRRRAAKSREQSRQSIEIEDMSDSISIPTVPRTKLLSGMPQEEAYSEMPQAGDYSGMPQEEAYSEMPQAGAYSEIPQAGDYSDMSQTEAYSEMPQTGAYSEMPQEEAYSEMPQAGNYSEMPQVGAYSEMPQTEEEVSLPNIEAEIRVDLDAEYFKWKEGNGEEEAAVPEKKARRTLFGRKL